MTIVKPHFMLDASALLALIFNEQGAEIVENALKRGAYITTVNLSEVVARLLREAFLMNEVHSLLPSLPMTILPVDEMMAYEAASYTLLTKPHGLSLGDRICLAAAKQSGYTALTADHIWSKLKLPHITIQTIR